jgi:hypothetical protein
VIDPSPSEEKRKRQRRKKAKQNGVPSVPFGFARELADTEPTNRMDSRR